MKRPLALVGFCYLLTLAAAVYFGAKWSLVLACICLLGFLLTVLHSKTRASGVFPVALLTVSLAFGSFAAYATSTVEPVQSLAGHDAVIEGTVCELPYQNYNRFYYIVEVTRTTIPNAPQTFKIRLSAQNAIHVEPYSKIKGKVHLFLPNGGEGYSSRSYYTSKGIMLFAYLYEYEGVQVSPVQEKPPYYYALQLRSALLQSIRSMLPPEQAKLVNGVLLGDQAGLSDEVAADFRTVGISHILSVSGLHMATMAELILMLLLFLKVPKKFAALIASVGVMGFMAITCFVPSVTRSGVMCLLYLFGIVFSRRPDSLNSLGAAVFLIGIANPYAAADVGLLLSFFATLGLILCSGKVSEYLNCKFDRFRKIRPLVRGVNGILATTFGAVLFTLPIVIVSFGSVSLISPVANIFELVASTLMMDFAAIAAVLNLIAPQSFLAMPFALLAGLLAKYMQSCAHWLAGIPFASVSASNRFVLIWLSGTLLLGAAVLLMPKKRRIYQSAALLSAILLLTGMASWRLSAQNTYRVAVLDVGSAESVVVTYNGHAAVIGCGGFSSGNISRYLRSEGISCVDYIQPLTRTREELVNCAELTDSFHPKRLVLQNDDLTDSFLQAALVSSGKYTGYDTTVETSLWGKIQLNTLTCGATDSVQISAGQMSILLCPGSTDLSLLPDDWLCSKFLVLDALPGKAELLAPAYTVLSMEEQDLHSLSPAINRMNAIATAGQGNVVLQMKNDAVLQIRRE